MAWIAYLVSLILWNAFALHTYAIAAFVIGMLFHWNYWLVGLSALFAGINLSK